MLTTQPVSSMKILFVGVKYDYGDSSRGYSYEWNHVYLGLKKYFATIEFFDFITLCNDYGKETMQSMLRKRLEEIKPDVTIFSLYTDQFDIDFIKSLNVYGKTLSFFQDDSWRIDFVKNWAPCFDAFTSSGFYRVKQYPQLGLDHAVFLPFGVNEDLFNLPDHDVSKDVDISFVGAWHPYREWLLKRLRKAGLNVEVYGYQWPSGPLTTKQMIVLFQRSKISLNLSNCACYDVRYLLTSPRGVLNTIRTEKQVEQLKGRHLEIPACGAMQLSYYVEGLEHVFNIGQEISVFASPDELENQLKFYLQHNDLCQSVASLGYQRVMRDHLYGQKFINIFKQLGWYKQ